MKKRQILQQVAAALVIMTGLYRLSTSRKTSVDLSPGPASSVIQGAADENQSIDRQETKPRADSSQALAVESGKTQQADPLDASGHRSGNHPSSRLQAGAVKSAHSLVKGRKTSLQRKFLADLRSRPAKEEFRIEVKGEEKLISLYETKNALFSRVVVEDGVQAHSGFPLMYVANSVHVSLPWGKGTNADAEAAIKAVPGVKSMKSIFRETYAVSFEFRDLKDRQRIIQDVKSLKSVDSVTNDHLYFSYAMPGDSSLKDSANGQAWQWHLNPSTTQYSTNVISAWDLQTDCSAVPVAIIDTGVSLQHPELTASLDTAQGATFIPGTANANDDNGHGTHVAGIIGALANNQVSGAYNTSGVCWKAKIIPVKALDFEGSATRTSVVEALSHVMEKTSARIINMSLGLAVERKDKDFVTMKNILDAVAAQGILIVAAAGNESLQIDTEFFSSPGGEDVPLLLTVGAADKSGNKAEFSNFGVKTVEVSAPGVDILSTVPAPESYASFNGTSMASPVAAGAAALIWAYDPKLSLSEVITVFKTNATAKPWAFRYVHADVQDPNQTVDKGNVTMEGSLLDVTSRFRSLLPAVALTGMFPKGFVVEGKNQVSFPFNNLGSKVSKVQILQGGAVIGESVVMPFEITFDAAAADSIELEVRVEMENGRTHAFPLEKIAMNKGPASEVVPPAANIIVTGLPYRVSVLTASSDNEPVAAVDLMDNGAPADMSPGLAMETETGAGTGTGTGGKPWSGTLTFAEPGKHELSSSASDGAGASGASVPRTVIVHELPDLGLSAETQSQVGGDLACRVEGFNADGFSLVLSQPLMRASTACRQYCEVVSPEYMQVFRRVTCTFGEEELLDIQKNESPG